MSLLLNMVVRNEANRYLQSCLNWCSPHVDRMFVWDDQSDDETVEIAKRSGAEVAVRDDRTPSFLEAEGLFREIGWRRMIDTLNPSVEDWVLCVDADEFPVPVDRLRTITRDAETKGFRSINVRMPEIFRLSPLSERTDRYWGGIVGTRLMKFEPSSDQTFRTPRMGSGVFPAYAYYCSNWNERSECGLRILHCGYAHEGDRQEKYDRYTAAIENGHSDAHIQSILQQASLKEWTGEKPEVYRGVH